jgi:hypothetical protein
MGQQLFGKVSTDSLKLLDSFFQVRPVFHCLNRLISVRAERMNIPPLATSAVPNGEKAVEALVI